MAVGSHQDAFKAHQLVKKMAEKNSNAILANLALDILLDFVKNSRQVNAEKSLESLPEDISQYDEAKTDKALAQVEKLCGKCDEGHDNNCFVNQVRRILIKIKTHVDLGSAFDGKKSLDDLLARARQLSQNHLKQVQQLSGEENPPQKKSPEEDFVVRGTSLAAQVAELELKFSELLEKDVFRSTLIDEIHQTITDVSSGNYAAEMPVHEDDQLGKLAAAFNTMLGAISKTMQSLDSLVAERSSELRMIMDTVPVGLLSVDKDLRINPEYSKSCEQILGMNNLRGRNFADVVGFTKANAKSRSTLMDFVDIFTQQLMPEEDLAPINPLREFQLEAADQEADQHGEIPVELDRRQRPRPEPRVKWIKSTFHLIKRGVEEPHILIVLEDITRAKEMAAEIAKAGKENSELKAIAEDPDLFCEFLSGAVKIISNAKESLQHVQTAADPKPLINDIFRGVHTIKGTSGAFGLATISSMAGELENRLSELRSANEIPGDIIRETEGTLQTLAGAVDEVVLNTQRLLGIEIGDSDDIPLRISSKAIQGQIQKINGMASGDYIKTHLIQSLATLRELTVPKGLARSLKIVPGLLERLDKNVDFKVKDHGTRIDCEIARELNTPLVHLIRNAFDHGIEPPDVRAEHGKSETGSVTLSVERDGGKLVIQINDDGQGLDADKLRNIALVKGHISENEAATMSQEDCLTLIFRAGFSTADSVSDISGRGVGMDAVLHTIKEVLRGSIDVESEVGKGTMFLIRLPAMPKWFSDLNE